MGFGRSGFLWLTIFLVATTAPVDPYVTPQFKWAQTLYHIFLVVTVKDLERSSIVITLKGVDHLSFEATGSNGQNVLELFLREDVRDHPKMTWEVLARKNRFGVQVLITMAKLNLHRWDRLLMDSSMYRKFMEKDWSRENATMEASEEYPYQEAFPEFLSAVTETNLNETIARSQPLLLNVKYPWCHACKKLEPIFLAVAKDFKNRAKQIPAYGDVTFGVLDPREERVLGRHFGAGLAPRCGVCEVKVLTEVGEEAEYIENIEVLEDLSDKIALYMTPSVDVLSSLQDATLESLKRTNVTCVGSFISETSDVYKLFKNVSRTLRGQLKFAAAFGEERAVEMWHPNSKKPYRYNGQWINTTEILAWVRSRSLPLLQVYDWRVRDRYDALGLPTAKLFLDTKDAFLNGNARSIIKRLATEYLGKVAFVEMHARDASYEMHDFMLDHPEVYPAFGLQSNNTAKAHRYGFAITDVVAPSVESFWKDEDSAIAKLRNFLKDAIDGSLPGAHESSVPQTDWSPGKTRHMCWREYDQITSPERPILLELWNRFRTDRAEKETSTENLAEVLLPYADNFTVARYDTGVNYFLAEHFAMRTSKATESEWYWIVRNNSASGSGSIILRKLLNPAKDASPRGVLEFAKRRSGLQLPVDEMMRQHELKMRVWKKFKSFTKLNELGPHPESGKFPKGFNLHVQVVELEDLETMADGTERRMVAVGDGTGVMKMRFEGAKELLLAVPGNTIEVRNAKIALVNGIMVVTVGKWGLITGHDGEAEVSANMEGNFSSLFFRDKKGDLRDEL